MKIKRAASIPLVTHDPYFSIWSPCDHAYDGSTEHWSGAKNRLEGFLNIDGVKYGFLGEVRRNIVIEQKSIAVTATSTEYVFENEKVVLKCKFTSPLVLDDPVLVSRPCTYVDFELEKKDAKDVTLEFHMNGELTRWNESDAMVDYQGRYQDFDYLFVGKARQHPMGSSGDAITIDWGYAYMACQEEGTVLTYHIDPSEDYVCLTMPLEDKKPA